MHSLSYPGSHPLGVMVRWYIFTCHVKNDSPPLVSLKCSSKIKTHLTLMLEGDLPGTQWAAVTTHWGATSVPPQKVKPSSVFICACHGHFPLGASVPPKKFACWVYIHIFLIHCCRRCHHRYHHLRKGYSYTCNWQTWTIHSYDCSSPVFPNRGSVHTCPDNLEIWGKWSWRFLSTFIWKRKVT